MPEYSDAGHIEHGSGGCRKVRGESCSVRVIYYTMMVDRYAKFATENMAFAASRIESGKDSNVIPLSRSCHVRKATRSG